MLFNSHLFVFLFLPVTLFGFYTAARYSQNFARHWLLVASLVFYGWWSLSYLVLLIAWAAANYWIGQKIAAERLRTPSHKRAWLIGAITANFLLLGYYKYSAFVLENVAALTGIEFAIGAVVLPLAISFHTFQQVAYLVECGRSKMAPHGLSDYLQFVFFFPQLIAGPIVLHEELVPQLTGNRIGQFKADAFAKGIAFFVLGLLKKLAIADPLASLATPFFFDASGAAPALLDAWVAALAFGLGLYFDFSAYSDMAVGLARMFGIELPYNFNSPYKATSISEFWRRWHITLSRWLRNYLYIPLGGSRHGTSRTYLNLLITMLLGGLWHGAAWTFLVWGGLHGLFLIVNHGWQRLREARAWPALNPFAARAVTFLAVTVAWVFFAAPSLSSAFATLAGMGGSHGLTHGVIWEGIELTITGGNPRNAMGPLTPYAILVAALALVFLGRNSQDLIEGVAMSVARAPRLGAVTGALAGAGFLTAIALLSDVKEFVYFQF